jgi:hypothetical protein
MSATLKRLVGIPYSYKLELQNFFSTVLADKLVLEYNVTGNTPSIRTGLYNDFVACGPSMGFSTKQFAYGLLELIISALVNNPDVPTEPYETDLNSQLVNVSRYVGLEGERDFHFSVAVYNLSVTLSAILDNVTPVGPILTLTLTTGGTGYTIDGTDEDETGVVFLATLALGDQTDPAQYADAVVEATIAGGIVTALTAIVSGGDGFAVGDVVDLVIDDSEAGQELSTGSGATATVATVG